MKVDIIQYKFYSKKMWISEMIYQYMLYADSARWRMHEKVLIIKIYYSQLIDIKQKLKSASYFQSFLYILQWTAQRFKSFE